MTAAPAYTPAPAEGCHQGEALAHKDPARYRLVGEHGRGGIGRVLKAVDEELGRNVAVKELHHLDSQSEARFVREARITARLEHPSIVPVHEAGRWPDGTPFYAMKLVSGRSLKELIASTTSFEERLKLLPHVQAVAEAIAYAHSERIIHRDLKPSNVIVGEFGETVVIDWGLAKDVSSPDDTVAEAGPYRTGESFDVTHAGDVVGTPAYMPPEQARGEEVDERADIYSLGAMLYHVLAGELPFSGRTSQEVLAQVLASTPPRIRNREQRCPTELAAIVEKAMDPVAERRYLKAADLARDLRHFQLGQLVTAQRYSRRMLFARWIRRHRAPLAVAMASAAILVSISGIGLRRIIQERNEATKQRTRAEQQRTLAETRANALVLQQARALHATDPTRSLELIKNYPVDAENWAAAHTIVDDAIRHGYSSLVLHPNLGGLVWGATSDNSQLAAAVGVDGLVVWNQDDRSPVLRHKYDRPLRPTVVRAIPGTARFVAGYHDGTLRLIDVPHKQVITQALHHTTIWDIAVSRDGRKVATASADGTVGLLDLETMQWEHLHGHTSDVGALRFLGDSILSVSDDGTLMSWNTVTHERTRLFRHDGWATDVAVSEDEKTFVTGDEAGNLWLHTRTAASRRLANTGGTVQLLTISRDGSIVGAATANWLGVWRANGELVYRSEPGGGRIALSRDGDLFAYAIPGKPISVVDLRTQDVIELTGPIGTISSLQFSPNGQVLSTSDDGSVRQWTLPPMPKSVFAVSSKSYTLAATSDGRAIATGGSSGCAGSA